MCQGISDLHVINRAESSCTMNLEERIDPHVHTYLHTHVHMLQQLAAVCCHLALTLDFNSSEVRYLRCTQKTCMYPWPEVLLHFSGITVSK